MRFQNTIISEFHTVVNEFVRDIDPIAVVCFNHSCSIDDHKGCFQVASTERHYYDLLIVQSDYVHFKDHEIADLIKSKCPDHLSINILSHSESSVSAALNEQHPFFCKVFNEGHILHLSENTQLLANEIRTTDYITNDRALSQECNRAFKLADNFVETASDALGSQMHDVAIFLLHQAMEQMCIASIKAHLKYRPTTHNIAKLIALVGCYIPQARNIFPCNTTEEQELLDFLRKAYSDVRYKFSYRVPPHIAFSLFERVTEFKNILEDRYKQQFEEAEEDLEESFVSK